MASEREVIGSGQDWRVVRTSSGVWLELDGGGHLIAIRLPADLGEILEASYEIGVSSCED